MLVGWSKDYHIRVCENRVAGLLEGGNDDTLISNNRLPYKGSRVNDNAEFVVGLELEGGNLVNVGEGDGGATFGPFGDAVLVMTAR